MTPDRARQIGFDAGRAGEAYRIAPEYLLGMTDAAIFQYQEGYAQGSAVRELSQQQQDQAA